MNTWEELYQRTKESTGSHNRKSFRRLYGKNLKESFGDERSAWAALAELVNNFKSNSKVQSLLSELEASDDYDDVIEYGLLSAFDKIEEIASTASSDDGWQKHSDYHAGVNSDLARR